MVRRWRDSGPRGWGGSQVTLAGPPSALLALSQHLFSCFCPKITPNCSPPPWHHLGSPTPDQRGKRTFPLVLGGSEPGKAASALGDPGALCQAADLPPRSRWARRGLGRHAGGPCQDDCQGARAGQLPPGSCSPLLGCDPVFTARSPWLVGLWRRGSQAETLLGLPLWEGEGVETDRTQLGLLPARPPPPQRSRSGLVCAAAGLRGPVFGPWLALGRAGASSHTCVGAGGSGWGQPRARRSWAISPPSWASVSSSVKEYEDLPVQE